MLGYAWFRFGQSQDQTPPRGKIVGFVYYRGGYTFARYKVHIVVCFSAASRQILRKFLCQPYINDRNVLPKRVNGGDTWEFRFRMDDDDTIQSCRSGVLAVGSELFQLLDEVFGDVTIQEREGLQ